MVTTTCIRSLAQPDNDQKPAHLERAFFVALAELEWLFADAIRANANRRSNSKYSMHLRSLVSNSSNEYVLLLVQHGHDVVAAHDQQFVVTDADFCSRV